VAQPDVAAFQFRRINAFQGLMIDASVWGDAHEYHRSQLRLHQLALHGWGIVQGLGVRVGESTNLLVVQPGIAIDPAGNIIVVQQEYRHQVDARAAGTVYLVLLFSEVLSGPNQPLGNGAGQPTRILEAYRIQQRDRLPDEPCIELARVELDPAAGSVRAPRDPAAPGTNELDWRQRVIIGTAPASPVTLAIAPALAELPPAPVQVAPITVPTQPAAQPATPSPAVPAASTQPPLLLGTAAHGGTGWECHRLGLRYLARDVSLATGRPVRVLDALPPGEWASVDFLYLTGQGRLSLGESEEAAVARVLERGSVVLGEGCAGGSSGEGGARDFANSFADLSIRLGRQIARVDRGHPMLAAQHVFSGPPTGGVPNANVLEAGGMVYSRADYGCAWQGGTTDRPLQRGAIRDAIEFGVNLVLYRRAEGA
jgi:hypothetical protein